jgi:uncharacterized membrane protein
MTRPDDRRSPPRVVPGHRFFRLAVASAVLSAIGLAVVVWYAGWGVHGCDDSSWCSSRMDRDFDAYLVGLASLACGLVLAVVTGVKARRSRRPVGSSPRG